MKVVLFCGGFGLRMREYSETVPKPMVKIGFRPILWHVMKYYAHFGHTDFILCLGWKANAIKEYFLAYDECMSNDFVLAGGGDSIKLLSSDIQDWNISFVDTGNQASIGERLMAVERHLDGEDVFLANYTDGLTDAPLPKVVDTLYEHDAVASFLSIKPTQSYHAIDASADGKVSSIASIQDCDLWMNGGFFAFRKEIFRYMEAGDELVEQPFQRLIRDGKLCTYKHRGFWSCMDTYKEMQSLEEMNAQGNTPWEVWNENGMIGRRKSEAGDQIVSTCPETNTVRSDLASA
jgi:glucose-1-phosphate cytidylyltransferase